MTSFTLRKQRRIWPSRVAVNQQPLRKLLNCSTNWYITLGHEKSVIPPLSMSQGPCKTHILMISPVHAYQRRDGTYSRFRCRMKLLGSGTSPNSTIAIVNSNKDHNATLRSGISEPRERGLHRLRYSQQYLVQRYKFFIDFGVVFGKKCYRRLHFPRFSAMYGINWQENVNATGSCREKTGSYFPKTGS